MQKHFYNFFFIIVLLFIILAPSYVYFRAKIALNAVICMTFFYVFLDNGFMTTWKLRILSFVFTVLIPFRERLSKYAVCWIGQIINSGIQIYRGQNLWIMADYDLGKPHCIAKVQQPMCTYRQKVTSLWLVESNLLCRCSSLSPLCFD